MSWRPTTLLSAVCVLLIIHSTPVSASCPHNCSGKGECDEAVNVCTCADGWMGEGCAQPSPTCDQLLRNCSGNGVCIGTSCRCNMGWGGQDCSLLATTCPRNCSGHGICRLGSCECDQGFSGPSCSSLHTRVSCPRNCSGHGMCDKGSCHCYPGFAGEEACEAIAWSCPDSLNNCTGKGVCMPSVSNDASSEWVCQCHEGFCGERCDEVCGSCPQNCTGHGICVGHTCECDAGFTGPDCARITTMEGCAASNCSAHGRCQKLYGRWQCVCDPGFTGQACDRVANYTSVCPRMCSGKGECFPSGCSCQPGFEGAACDKARPTCASANFCSGNGVCYRGSCLCYKGFSGFDCTQACHPNATGFIGCFVDKGRGKCLNGTCYCRPDYTGVGCENLVDEALFEEYQRGRQPIGSVVLAGSVAITGAAALAIVGAVVYKLTQSKGGKKKGKKSTGQFSSVFTGPDFDDGDDLYTADLPVEGHGFDEDEGEGLDSLPVPITDVVGEAPPKFRRQ